MAKAKAEPNTRLTFAHGSESLTFEFGDDGTRQVTQNEIAALESYAANGGAVKVEITQDKSKQGAK